MTELTYIRKNTKVHPTQFAAQIALANKSDMTKWQIARYNGWFVVVAA